MEEKTMKCSNCSRILDVPSELNKIIKLECPDCGNQQLLGNFKELFEKFILLKKERNKKIKYLIVSIIIPLLLLGLGLLLLGLLPLCAPVFIITGGIGVIVSRVILHQMHEARFEFNDFVKINKYNFCYYILKQRPDLKGKFKLRDLGDISKLEETIDNKKYRNKINNRLTDKLVTQFLEAVTIEELTNEIQRICPKCNRPLKPDWKVCPMCDK